MNRLFRQAASALVAASTAASLLTGCTGTSETAAERTARLDPVVRAVPGVTGGTFEVKNASLSHLYSCDLTSDATTTEGLKTVLTDVLRALAAAEPAESESMVYCSVTNTAEQVGSGDLGLNDTYTTFHEVRQKLG